MASIKYSTPGIYQQEIDNTIQSNASPAAIGIGAIVMKSNKGPVNQRVLTNSYNQFTEVFGEPENLDDYGHFAAENYLANSNNLLVVRAAMGDEGYAQIQYPYSNSEANSTMISEDIASFKYINNANENNLDLLVPVETLTEVAALTGEGQYKAEGTEGRNFFLNQYAQFATITDLITDNAPAVAVFKSVYKGGEEDFNPQSTDGLFKENEDEGKYVRFVSKVAPNGEAVKYFDDLIIRNDAWTSGEIPKENFIIDGKEYIYDTTTGVKVVFTVPAAQTLNNAKVAVTAYLNKEYVTSAISGAESVSISSLFQDQNFYKGEYSETTGYCDEPVDAVKIQFIDWDDCIKKTHYVAKNELSNTIGQAVGLQYREFGLADYSEDLAVNGVEGLNPEIVLMKDCTADEINQLADEYGVDAAEINNEKYGVLKYNKVWNGVNVDDADFMAELAEERIVKVVYINDDKISRPASEGKTSLIMSQDLFWIIAKQNAKTPSTISVFTAEKPSPVIIPWQDNMKNAEGTVRNKLIAFPTSEVLNGTDETYRDGYTLSIESDDEPGNGDIERYESVFDDQLIIAAIGPGAFGNDIGVSVITTECADIPALNHQNAFCWKYRYDDEDQVDADVDDLTWKKVYRINVYTKPKTQTAEAAWGFGMDALLKEPAESFYVSNDPTAKDGEGNSLYAPNVVNGHSQYIYVSRNSVNGAMTGAGTYAQPRQTYAIYGLTGGTNSKKNKMTEKTAALKLYADRQKANFDILFNADAVDSFQSRERFAAHQRRIAEIAASRTMDIGVVQVTSKEAKGVKKMLSEGKMFSFNNGTYVAEYAGYDKYYNGKLASWIYLPKSVAGACAMAYCDTYAYPWMAPAGYSRGGIAYAAGQLSRLSDPEIGQLYDSNINTSRLCGGFGELLWGQKTALKKESALNRINVRRCMNFIEKQLENMMTPYLYEQNTPNTRSAARNTIDSFLSRVKAAEGIVSYELSVTQDSEDPHIMNVNIRLVPAEAIEAIFIKYTISRDTGISVEETM